MSPPRLPDSHPIEKELFEAFLLDKENVNPAVLRLDEHGEYQMPAISLLWRIWTHRGSISSKVHSWTALAPEGEISLATEEAVDRCRSGVQEVAVGIHPNQPYASTPKHWAGKVFAHIEWYQFAADHPFEVAGCAGWQLSKDQTDTVLEQIVQGGKLEQ